jgi:glycosyltransferase involved in cell wall biosynthesis
LKSNSLISIIIPTYNRAVLLPETLDSILAQTHNNWECVIVDDGSTDNTVEVINRYSELESRIKLYERPKERLKGANACRNFGFEKSKGEFINWFDSDDIMLPNFLAEKLKIFENNPKLDAVCSYGAYFEFDKSLFEIRKPELNGTNHLVDYVSSKLFFITHGPLWKKSFLDSKVLFDENRPKLQDTEFHFRMLIHNLNFKFYEQDFLFLIRRGDDRISSKKTLTLKKLESVLEYHYLTMISTDKVNSKYKKKYLEVTSSNLLKSFYELVVLQDSLSVRCKLLTKHNKKLKIATSNLRYNLQSEIEINAGIILSVIFKKGFSLLAK